MAVELVTAFLPTFRTLQQFVDFALNIGVRIPQQRAPPRTNVGAQSIFQGQHAVWTLAEVGCLRQSTRSFRVEPRWSHTLATSSKIRYLQLATGLVEVWHTGQCIMREPKSGRAFFARRPVESPNFTFRFAV
jgi:hypothetical protein